jgi:hypothetical protein
VKVCLDHLTFHNSCIVLAYFRESSSRNSQCAMHIHRPTIGSQEHMKRLYMDMLVFILHVDRGAIQSRWRISLVSWLRHGQQQHLIDRTRAHILHVWRYRHTTAIDHVLTYPITREYHVEPHLERTDTSRSFLGGRDDRGSDRCERGAPRESKTARKKH